MIREFCSKVINFDSKCWRSDLNVLKRLRCAFISENEVNASNVKKKKILQKGTNKIERENNKIPMIM